MAINQTIGN